MYKLNRPIVVVKTYISQSGMQAIHYAAASGHTDVLNLLIDLFGIDPQEKEAEVSCTNEVP